MVRLEITLLGTFQARLDGEVVAGFRSDKTRALLAYLAVEGTRSHRRDWLAALLWGDFEDRSARRSLSSALANLRQLLAPLSDASTAPPLLDSDRNDVWFRIDPATVSVDVLAFRHLLGLTEKHTHRSVLHCAACIKALTQAAVAYGGPFLPGLTFGDSPAFDEWQRAQQENLHQQALHIFGVLTSHHRVSGNLGTAEQYARRQISLQPWHEEAHRQLMMILASAGQRNAALTQYELCRALLASELAVEPEEQTTALYNQIRLGATIVSPPLRDSLPNPYHGLQPFRESDAADFYGRQAITRQIVEAVEKRSLVAVIGPSGSGKSSVLHAGVIHRLHRAAGGGDQETGPAATTLARSVPWTICEVRPGGHPFPALASAIAPHLKAAANRQSWAAAPGREDLAQRLASGQASLAALLFDDAAASPPARFLLVLDQFEELYTLCADVDTQQRFIDLLVATTAQPVSPPITVLLAVRADFMGQLLSHRALADALQGGTIMLGPMNRQELTEAIASPARSQGVRLQDGLVARILNDVGQAPGRLPLLEFALTQLWQQQTGGFLTHEAYETIGQVEGALASYADQVFATLSPTEQTAARRIFTQMVQIGQDTDDTRRPVLAAEVGAEDWELIQKLADQRLVVTDLDGRGQEVAEIAHEALIRSWRRLQGWLNDDRAFYLWQQHARVAADQWLASQRDPGALLRGAPLAEAEHWTSARKPGITPRIWDFVAASKAQRQREETEAEAQRRITLTQVEALAEAERRRADVEARSNWRLRWLAIALSLVSVLAGLAGLLAFTQRNEALRQTTLAQAAEATAEAERRIALQETYHARARQLAAQSINLAATEPDRAILLALHALRLNPIPEEDGAFLLDLELSPLLGAVLHGQTSSAHGMAVSPDGRILASGGENGAIWLWDLSTHRPLGPPLTGHNQAVAALVFADDSTRLFSGAWDGAIRAWDVSKLEPLGEPIAAHTAAVTALALDPDGRTLRSIGDDGTMKSWDIASGAPAGLEWPLAERNGMAFSTNGELIASKDDLTITVQSALDGQMIGQPMVGHSASIHEMVFDPAGALLASVGFDGVAIVWDVRTSRPLYPPLAAHDGRVLAAAFSPDGRVLATGSTDSRIFLWDVASGQPLGPPLSGHGNWVRTLVWTPDGKQLISGDAAGKIVIWETGRMQRWLGHASTVRGLAFSPDGRTLASGSFDASVRLREVASGQDRLAPLRGHENAVINVAYSPDGSYLVSASAGGELARWDTASGRPIGEPLRGHSGPVAGVAISPDNRTIASGSFDNTIILWDAATGRPLRGPIQGHDNWVITLAFSPDGRTLASGSADATVRLWDAATGQLVGEPLRGHTGWVTSLAWSADGATLVSGSLDETVRFWDVTSGQTAGEPLSGHEAPVWSVFFNPADGGRSLITGDNSGTVIWWDVATRQALAPPLHTEIETESMAISPDGATLAIGSFGGDGAVSLWRIPAERWEQRGCAIANRDLSMQERRQYIGDIPYVEACPMP